MPSSTHQKGDFGQLKIILDLIKQGYSISIPFSEGLRYDLIADRNGELIRIQCKYVTSVLGKTVAHLSSRGQGLYKIYTSDEIDMIAVYDSVTDTIQYIEPNGHPNKTLYFESE